MPLKQTSINKAIEALTGLLSPNKKATTTKENVVPPRVGMSQKKKQAKNQACPKVNNNQSERVLQPRHAEIPKKYIRGTFVYNKFNKKFHWVYICDYDKYECYYKMQYKDGNSEEYN